LGVAEGDFGVDLQDLESSGAELLVDPGLMEIAGPRLHVTAVDGLPLLRLTEPAVTGVPRMVKRLIDVLGAALLLVLIAPVMIALAIAVRCDGGPVFYCQSRVGRHGKLFSMIKFRSMVVNADQHRPDLAPNNQGFGPLFKLRQDPRVTSVDRFLRKYSLDELPQLFNLSFSMSFRGRCHWLGRYRRWPRKWTATAAMRNASFWSSRG
jgi:lipopolysaccharide/colanic/teichoic acid biosynthesis glycosyltransferase